jgi:hypothetical protein
LGISLIEMGSLNLVSAIEIIPFAAIRDLLCTSGSEWTLEQIAVQFKGATRSKKAIAECLEASKNWVSSPVMPKRESLASILQSYKRQVDRDNSGQ